MGTVEQELLKRSLRRWSLRLPYGVFELVGLDAVRFLQGQVTADIETLKVGDAVDSFLLAPTGRIVAVLRIYLRAEDTLLILVELESMSATIERLRKYLIRTKAQIVTREELGVWYLSRAVENDDSIRWKPEIEMPPLFQGIEGSVVVGELADEVAELQDSAHVYGWHRIAAAFPLNSNEEVSGAIPSSFPYLVSRAISFSKGCYVGQELVERMDSRDSRAPVSFLSFEVKSFSDGLEGVCDLRGLELRTGDDQTGVVTSYSAGLPASAMHSSPVLIGRIKRAHLGLEQMEVWSETQRVATVERIGGV